MTNAQAAAVIRLAVKLFEPRLTLNEEQTAEWLRRLAHYERDEAETAVRACLAENEWLTLDRLMAKLHEGRRANAAKTDAMRAEQLAKQKAEDEQLLAEEARIRREVLALGEARLQEWKVRIIEHEPVHRFAAGKPVDSPYWLGLIHSRAIEDVAYVPGPQGKAIAVPREQYWASLAGKPTSPSNSLFQTALQEATR